MVERYTKSVRFEDSLKVLARPDVFPLLLIADCTESQNVQSKKIVDIPLRSGLSSIKKGGSFNASILHEVSCQKGNERY